MTPFSYSQISSANLAECEPQLRRIFDFVIQHWDCTIIDGRRTVAEERQNVADGASQTMNSKHLPDAAGLSRAVDVLPYPFDYDSIERGINAIKKADPHMQIAEVYAFIGYVRGVADMMGIPLRQGADWNSNHQFEDQSFDDLPHHELL